MIVYILVHYTMFWSPLEQFSIFPIVSIALTDLFDFSITNSVVFVSIAISLLFMLLLMISSKMTYIPTIWQVLLESLYSFVFFSILSENIKKGGVIYFPIMISIFVFILISNLIGMIPFSFTATSHIIVTLSLASMIFIGINIIGIRTHGLHMLSLFLPAGAPLALAPLLVFIEMGSYAFRVVSLSLRLFANMMSGHCLLKILAGFGWTMFSSANILTIAHIMPVAVVFVIMGLELGIAFLQAYVFTLLLCV